MSNPSQTRRRGRPARPSFRVVTWNIGGAKYFGLPEISTAESSYTRSDFQQTLNSDLQRLTRDFQPDVILMQETVRFGSASHPYDLIQVECLPDYHYDMSIAIDTINQSHPQKWDRYRPFWPEGTYLAQGYGILWRNELHHAAIWEFEGSRGAKLQKEIVRLETGLFTGSRDTEPRLAVVYHFIFELGENTLDVFLVNLHLTTINGEREGSPQKDVAASRVRRQQLETVVNGVVSRYNDWAREKCRKEGTKRMPSVWVIGGDFNCMPSSPEIIGMKGVNFIDLNPNKGSGTKGSSVPILEATITLDYLFAGPAFYSLDPYLAELGLNVNPLPLAQYCVSDHFPVLADVPIVPMREEE